MPIQRRLPKFGFKNANRVEYKGINISSLQTLADKLKLEKIDIDIIRENGLASKNDLIKMVFCDLIKIWPNIPLALESSRRVLA